MLRMQRILLMSAMLLVGLMLGGCADQTVPTASLIGTYKVTYEPYAGVIFGTEELTLKADGTYEQTFHPTHGKGWSSKGAWSVDISSQGTEVHLLNRMEALDEWGSHMRTKPQRANFYLPAEVRSGTVVITIDDDMGYYYRKVK